jgi:hypothetical protein
MDTLTGILTGAVAMAFLVVALFFLRFWARTRDPFFALFAAAFAIYGSSQFALGWGRASEFEPLFYVPRLLTFALIVIAVAIKNRAARPPRT